MVARAGHKPHLTPDQRAAVDSLLLLFESNPSAPPSVKECTEAIGAELFAALRDQGRLVTVSTEVVFTGERYAAMVDTIKAELDRRGQLTLADVRDLFGTSRRYAQALLEHLDRIGVTRRTGDARTLTAGASSRPD
jgi:selenocysteine-specific elongation factor